MKVDIKKHLFTGYNARAQITKKLFFNHFFKRFSNNQFLKEKITFTTIKLSINFILEKTIIQLKF
jgi:hypothetical protein